MISIFHVRSNGAMASSPPLGGSVVGAVDDSGQNLSGRAFQCQDLASGIFNHRRDAKCCQGSRAKEGGMAVPAVRRLGFFFMANTLEPRSHVPHTGGTPVPLSFSSTDSGSACRNARATQLKCSAGVPPAIGILSPAGETPALQAVYQSRTPVSKNGTAVSKIGGAVAKKDPLGNKSPDGNRSLEGAAPSAPWIATFKNSNFL